eukprot:Phypoly_transcript_25472.p1 GENE.Phypoly_transcript_25472~~Phypoly_transcript_25472.p1  ORF type:complete len:125 (+),score=8.89 Phypoly_transcript_25472:130-504(+)
MEIWVKERSGAPECSLIRWLSFFFCNLCPFSRIFLKEKKKRKGKKYIDFKIRKILFVHGTGDTVTSYHATQQVHDLATSTDKTLKLFDGWYHEPHNETEKEELFTYVAEWLRNHMPVSPASGGA